MTPATVPLPTTVAPVLPAQPSPPLVVRPATLRDVPSILALVNRLAQQQVMLPRSPASVIEGIRDFRVAEVDGDFVGCGALHVVWADLAEVRSLAVDPDAQRSGAGRAMVEALVSDAQALGVPRLFAFTYVPGFFEKLSFHVVQHEALPHKVFKDCLHCPKFQACDEIAMERILDPSAVRGAPGALPVLSPLPVRVPRVRAP